MKLLPDEFAIQMLMQAKETASQLFGVILDAIGENIATGWIGFWSAVFANEWSAAATMGFVLFSAVLLGCRLIRNNLFDSVEHLFSKL